MRQYFSVKVRNTFPVVFLYLTFGLYSCAKSQAVQRICERGVAVSYGFHNFTKTKSENRLTGFSPSSRGISIGYVMGNSLVKGRIRALGFYESTN